MLKFKISKNNGITTINSTMNSIALPEHGPSAFEVVREKDKRLRNESFDMSHFPYNSSMGDVYRMDVFGHEPYKNTRATEEFLCAVKRVEEEYNESYGSFKFFDETMAISCGFAAWVASNHYVFMSGFIMEGKTALLSEYAKHGGNFNIEDSDISHKAYKIAVIRESDYLWRVKSKINDKELLENEHDVWMIKLLWLSAYINQLWSIYQTSPHVPHTIIADRCFFDHDIFDYVFDDIFQSTIPLASRLAYKLSYLLEETRHTPCVTSMYAMFHTQNICFPRRLYIHRVRKQFPQIVENRPGREFEYKFYANSERGKALQLQFYWLLDHVTGLAHLAPQCGNLTSVCHDLESVARVYFAECVSLASEASDYMNSSYIWQKHMDDGHRMFLNLKRLLLSYVCCLDNEYRHNYRNYIAHGFLGNINKPTILGTDIVYTMCTGHIAEGKTAWAKDQEQCVYLAEVSDFWRNSYPKNIFFKSHLMQYVSFLVRSYITMLRTTHRNPIIVSDRSPIDFAMFAYESYSDDELVQVARSYCKIFRIIMSSFSNRMRITYKKMMNENIIAWPFHAYRDYEIAHYKTIEDYAAAKFKYYRRLTHVLTKIDEE